MTYLALRSPLPALVAGAVIAAATRGWQTLLTSGVPMLLLGVAVLVLLAPRQREAVTLLGGTPVADPHRETEHDGSVSAVLLRVRERSTAREVLHALTIIALAPLDVALAFSWLLALVLVLTPALVLSGHPVSVGPLTMTTPIQALAGAGGGLAGSVAGAVAISRLAEAHAHLVRVLLGPRGEELREQVSDLTRSRLRLVNAFDVERRRIERDLHDGAQQQLISLVMTLDLARIELEGLPRGEAAALVDQAHAQASQTIGELRALIHGIHPPVLTELGLPAALEALAERSVLAVDLTLGPGLDTGQRLPASVESAAYFIAAEALANAAKHSGADRVHVALGATPDVVTLQISDDGGGGAQAGHGSGLTGLGDRVAAVGGNLRLSSPPGGPTVVRAEIPLPQSAASTRPSSSTPAERTGTGEAVPGTGTTRARTEDETRERTGGPDQPRSQTGPGPRRRRGGEHPHGH
ncbi:histidine kinase [Kineococcus sp. GCM10028916]